MKTHRPDFAHNKARIPNDGCPCCQRDSHKNIKKLTNKIRRRLFKRELEKLTVNLFEIDFA
jgi:DUF1680 family protein